MLVRAPLGIPGVYEVPDAPLRSLTGVRMDVCAFVGIAPRGPAQRPVFRASWMDPPTEELPENLRTVPVAIESWADYRRIFGGFEGPGRLPYAVASFFENGGRRAWILRIVPPAEPLAAEPEHRLDVAFGRFDAGGVPLRHTGGSALEVQAQNPGSWGNVLSAELRFHAITRLPFTVRAALSELVVPLRTELAAGALLRFQHAGGHVELRFVSQLRDEWSATNSERHRIATLDAPLPDVPDSVELVEAELDVLEAGVVRERHVRLGASSLHPRWVARVLIEESSLLHPVSTQLEGALALEAGLLAGSTPKLSGGADPYDRTSPEHFFGPEPPPGPETGPSEGLGTLDALRDVALFVVPDLYSPEALRPVRGSSAAPRSPRFERCATPIAEVLTQPHVDLPLLRLDPSSPADLEVITGLQERVVRTAERLRFPIALLDAPPRITHARLLAWRARFDSAFAAVYHPWLRVGRADDGTGRLQMIGPAAVAAGIIARKEHTSGVAFGPAQELAANVLSVVEEVRTSRHEELFALAINLFVRSREGALLSSARTASRRRDYRQLSVRRLTSMIERALEEQMQWVVFEPNDAATRSELKQLVSAFLRQLFRANAFAGATEETSFFVHCDDRNNPQSLVDRGVLLAEIGIRPAEPLEFILFRLVRSADGALSMES
jgi:hypothetical protein